MKCSLFALMLCAGLLAAPVQAQPRPQKPPPPATVGNSYQKVTKFEFDNDPVEGVLQRPDDLVVTGANRRRPSSLIKVRASFLPEMLKSIEQL